MLKPQDQQATKCKTCCRVHASVLLHFWYARKSISKLNRPKDNRVMRET